MDIPHEFLVGFAKSFGLFWLIGLSIAITAYAFWPSLGKKFDKAAKSIMDDDQGPAKEGDEQGSAKETAPTKDTTREENAACR